MGKEDEEEEEEEEWFYFLVVVFLSCALSKFYFKAKSYLLRELKVMCTALDPLWSFLMMSII